MEVSEGERDVGKGRTCMSWFWPSAEAKAQYGSDN